MKSKNIILTQILLSLLIISGCGGGGGTSVPIPHSTPVVSISVDKESGTAPITVTLSASCVNQYGSCISYSWDLGDGSVVPATDPIDGAIYHTYYNGGTYKITLIGTNGAGDTGQTSRTFTYSSLPSSGNPPGNEWITIPAGDFILGCASGDTNCNTLDVPRRMVTLSAYKIQKYEVTNAQYKACVDANICSPPSKSTDANGRPYYGNTTYNNYPVIYMDWEQATTYCAWIGGRLPTEAQWEKAARGPSPNENIYPWGNDTPTCSTANVCGSSLNQYISAVGSYAMDDSYYGIMDMGGNLMEWVNDWLWDFSSGTSVDPQGPSYNDYGGNEIKILKGGTFTGYATISHWSGTNATNTSGLLYGFRCAQN